MSKVEVPKDFEEVDLPVFSIFTKRQLLFLLLDVLICVPVYFLTREWLSIDGSVFLLMLISAPIFLLAVFKRNGLRGEDYLLLFLRHRFWQRPIRLYQTDSARNILCKKLIRKGGKANGKRSQAKS